VVLSGIVLDQAGRESFLVEQQVVGGIISFATSGPESRAKMVEVKRLAHKIRDAFEEIYRHQFKNPSSNPTLGGFCKRASVQFFIEAQRLGYDVRLVAADGHVYNVYDGHIIDITATQFGKTDRVWITKQIGNQTGYWQPKKNGNELSSLDELYKAGWSSWSEEFNKDSEMVAKYLSENNELCV